MRNDWGKRVLIFVLSACFVALVYLCAEGRTIIRWTAEVSNPRQNESLYVEWRTDDVLYVGGEGKLFGTDMQAMVEGESLLIADVQNIIVGDGITEIGYGAFSKFDSLKTLWRHHERYGEEPAEAEKCQSIPGARGNRLLRSAG